MTRRRKCRSLEHKDVRVRGGRRYECSECGDSFPCAFECVHLACIVVTGRELPDFVSPEAREAIAAELAAMGYAFASLASSHAEEVLTPTFADLTVVEAQAEAEVEAQ